MTAKPSWTDEEKFWRSVRQAVLGLVDAIETWKLTKHIDVRTAEMRKWLKSYQRAYTFPPVAAEDVKEGIEALREAAGVLTTEPERGKL